MMGAQPYQIHQYFSVTPDKSNMKAKRLHVQDLRFPLEDVREVLSEFGAERRLCDRLLRSLYGFNSVA